VPEEQCGIEAAALVTMLATDLSVRELGWQRPAMCEGLWLGRRYVPGNGHGLLFAFYARYGVRYRILLMVAIVCVQFGASARPDVRNLIHISI